MDGLNLGTKGPAKLKGREARGPVQGSEATGSQGFAVRWKLWAPVSLEEELTLQLKADTRAADVSFASPAYTIACSKLQNEPHVIQRPVSLPLKYQLRGTSFRA